MSSLYKETSEVKQNISSINYLPLTKYDLTVVTKILEHDKIFYSMCVTNCGNYDTWTQSIDEQNIYYSHKSIMYLDQILIYT